jgi:hypothetical protein
MLRQGTLAVFLLLLISCCGRPAQPAPLFPESVGLWSLKHSSDLASSQIPEQIRRMGIRRAGTAEYQGPGAVKVEIYELTTDAGAMEVEQTWRPMADTVAFHKGTYFTVIHWESADKAAVAAFVRELEKR